MVDKAQAQLDVGLADGLPMDNPQLILSDAGINWNDLNTLTAAGINWNDLNALTAAGINWNDFVSLTG